MPTSARTPAPSPGTGPAAAARGGAARPGWWRRRGPRTRRVLLSALVTALLVLTGVGGLVYTAARVPLPQQVDQPQLSRIVYADNSSLASVGQVNRTDVALSQVPLSVQRAVLAAEDRGYYKEPGISIRGIGRALWADVRGGGVSQGGSTITQQYVKNAYLTQARTLSRKLKEIAIAVKLDRKYSKNTVLGWYLNTIYFGRGAYGIQAAASAYFNRPASALTLGQGAVLAGLIRAPSGLDPRNHPAAARRRWDEVLATMVTQRWLTPAQRAALTYPPTLPQHRSATSLPATTAYLRDEVERELQADGFSPDEINRGGLRVVTTLDPKTQQAAVTAVQARLGGAPADLQTALVAVEPGTGRVRAWYGGGVYGSGDYLDNVSQSTTQPGSSFKPIVLAAALSKGIGLSTSYSGADAQSFPGTGYTPANPLHNFGSESFGAVDLPFALANSVNTVFVHLGLDAGLAAVAATGHAMGIPASVDLPQTASLSLGVASVHPLDMATVYTTFAGNGVRVTPHLVDYVRDRTGKVVYKASGQATRVLSQGVAADATAAMQQVVQAGTGTAAQLAGGRPAAGKTGTTSGNRSAWFCGYTPQLATVVALFRQPYRPLTGLLGINEVTGGTLPAQVWKAFTDAALAGQPVEQFPPRANVGSVTPVPPPVTAAPATTSPAAPPTSTSPSPSPSPPPSPPTPPSPSTSPSPSPSGIASPSRSPRPSRTPAAAGPPAAGASGAAVPPAR